MRIPKVLTKSRTDDSEAQRIQKWSGQESRAEEDGTIGNVEGCLSRVVLDVVEYLVRNFGERTRRR